MATRASEDFRPIAFSVQKSFKARMRQRIKTAKEVRKNKIPVHITYIIRAKYGKSDQMRYVNDLAVALASIVLHHLDVPWRPSEEERAGWYVEKSIKQGILLFSSYNQKDCCKKYSRYRLNDVIKYVQI